MWSSADELALSAVHWVRASGRVALVASASADERQCVRLVPHDPNWITAAVAESVRLQGALGRACSEILHLGSTAIPGIAAKPTIDLFPVVTHLGAVDTQRDDVEALGYYWHGEYGLSGRRFCTRDVAGVRLFNVHIYTKESPAVARHRNFHAYLVAHPDEARAYESVKLRAAAMHPEDTLRYNDAKSAWIKACEVRATAWVECGGRAERHPLWGDL